MDGRLEHLCFSGVEGQTVGWAVVAEDSQRSGDFRDCSNEKAVIRVPSVHGEGILLEYV